MASNIYVKNIDYSISDEDLYHVFAAYGKVTSLHIVRDWRGRSRGFGFLSFGSVHDAHRAILELNGKCVGRKQLDVQLHIPKDERQQLIRIREQVMATATQQLLQSAARNHSYRPSLSMMASGYGNPYQPTHDLPYNAPFGAMDDRLDAFHSRGYPPAGYDDVYRGAGGYHVPVPQPPMGGLPDSMDYSYGGGRGFAGGGRGFGYEGSGAVGGRGGHVGQHVDQYHPSLASVPQAGQALPLRGGPGDAALSQTRPLPTGRNPVVGYDTPLGYAESLIPGASGTAGASDMVNPPRSGGDMHQPALGGYVGQPGAALPFRKNAGDLAGVSQSVGGPFYGQQQQQQQGDYHHQYGAGSAFPPPSWNRPVNGHADANTMVSPEAAPFYPSQGGRFGPSGGAQPVVGDGYPAPAGALYPPLAAGSNGALHGPGVVSPGNHSAGPWQLAPGGLRDATREREPQDPPGVGVGAGAGAGAVGVVHSPHGHPLNEGSVDDRHFNALGMARDAMNAQSVYQLLGDHRSPMPSTMQFNGREQEDWQRDFHEPFSTGSNVGVPLLGSRSTEEYSTGPVPGPGPQAGSNGGGGAVNGESAYPGIIYREIDLNAHETKPLESSAATEVNTSNGSSGNTSLGSSLLPEQDTTQHLERLLDKLTVSAVEGI